MLSGGHASPTIENRTPRATLKAHGNKRQSGGNQHRHYTRRTLGVGIRHAVSLPAGERLSEWLASHTIDFYHAVCMLVGIVADDNETRGLEPGRGFPPGFEYLWADTVAKRTIKCNGPQYVDLVLNWVQGIINDRNIFPQSQQQNGPCPPRDFEKTCKGVFKRLFRVFAILYTHHYQRMESMGAVAHLNTTFKHFMFFCFEFDLVPAAELEAIDTLVDRMRIEFNAQGGKSGPAASTSSPSPK